MTQPYRKETGFSLTETMIAMVILSAVMSGALVLFKNINKARETSQDQITLSELRWLIRDNLDCAETLSVTPSTVLPLDCSQIPSTLTLKKRYSTKGVNQKATSLLRNREIALPKGTSWDLKSYCDSSQSKPYINVQIKNKKIKNAAWENLFPKNAALCSEYFIRDPFRDFNPNTDPNPCGGSYPIFASAQGDVPRCCRITKQTASAQQAVSESCKSNEFLLQGISSCGLATADITQPNLNPLQNKQRNRIKTSIVAGGILGAIGGTGPAMAIGVLWANDVLEGRNVPVGGLMRSNGPTIKNSGDKKSQGWLTQCYDSDWGADGKNDRTKKNNMGYPAYSVGICCPMFAYRQ